MCLCVPPTATHHDCKVDERRGDAYGLLWLFEDFVGLLKVVNRGARITVLPVAREHAGKRVQPRGQPLGVACSVVEGDAA